MSLLSTPPTSPCPLCGSAATRVHSRYQRRLADLPSAGQPVCFLLSVRKFFCDVPTCPRKIFAERLSPFSDPFARVTRRLFQIVQIIGLATGGRLGVRVTDRLAIQTSRQTILRRIMALPTEPVGQVPQMGLDDFSFRRGRKFGTIIVDLHTHKMLDVLPDRTADSAVAWMAAHPEIELVSRNRRGDYASAATTGAPQAVQCADRFHILKNLGEAVEGCLARHLAAKRQAHPQDLFEDPAPLPVRKVMFLFLRRPDDLDKEEQGIILQMRQSHAELDLAYDLVQEFAAMLRTRTGENLDAWLTKAVASRGHPEQ